MMSSDRKPGDSGDWIPPWKMGSKPKPMNTLDLNPTQLTYLKKAVDKMLHPYGDRQNVRLSTRYTDLSEQEKEDLKRKLEQLKPKTVEV